jgi:uncharacterized protein (DUF1800 family)
MPTLTPKTNVLGFSNAYHLLRRTTYNITKPRILEYASKTPQEAVAALFTFTPPDPPHPLNDRGETIVPTVANPTITEKEEISAYSKNDAYWWLYCAMKDGSAQHKIAFFLHLLFITDDNAMYWFNYDYKELLRIYTTGSIKELALKITQNPRMLGYLNNSSNHKRSPNQNYAREFLELFTILKGPQIDTGNYTNYTELDVQEAARVLTGFTYTSSVQTDKKARLTTLDPDTHLPSGHIDVSRHDTGLKIFSAAFNNESIVGGITEDTILEELQNFINMIFNQDETAKAYCRRIYRYFVSRDITPEIEAGIITPLAGVLKSNNYNIIPTLTTLLTSQHFYDEEDAVIGDKVIGSLVRNPVELYLHLFTLLELQFPLYTENALAIHRIMGWGVRSYSGSAGMLVFTPPSVNGYAGYSSSPNYDKNWITTTTLRSRYNNTIDHLINGLNYNNHIFKVNIASFVKDSGYFSNQEDADTLVKEFLQMMFVKVPDGERYNYFRTVLLGRLTLDNWKTEWNNYKRTNVDTNVKIIFNRFVRAIIKSPEFQII